MKRLNQDERTKYIESIATLLKGLSYHQSIEMLCEAISYFVTEHKKSIIDTGVDAISTEPDEPITDVASAFRYLRQLRRVPKKVLKPDPYAPVWDYLETLDSYTSITDLRQQLLEQFGEEATPSTERLYWFLLANRESTKDRLRDPILLFNSRFYSRRRGHLSLLEKDPEIQEFLSNLDRYYTGPELLAMMEKRFGKERTPSKSSLNRYLHKFTKLTDSESDGGKS